MHSVLNYYLFAYFHKASFSCWLKFSVGSLVFLGAQPEKDFPLYQHCFLQNPNLPYISNTSISLDGWIYIAIRLAVEFFGLTQHSIQIVTGAISTRVVRSEREADHSPSSDTI